MAKKAPNYSPELTDAVVNDYLAGKPVEDIADAIGKSVRSVRSKLVREGVYVAQEKPKGAKRDNGPSKKELFIQLRAKKPDVPDGAFAMSKEALEYFVKMFEWDEDPEPEDFEKGGIFEGYKKP